MTAEVEYRMLVHGWKVEDGKRRDFVSTGLYSDSGLKYEEGRIGEDVPDWQPHITHVTVEERTVTPWQETYRTPEATRARPMSDGSWQTKRCAAS